MAINIPIISEFQDKGIKAAKAAFANFKTSIADAEGGMNKFKAGSKSALDAVGANAQAFAIAGGIALAKFAMEGVKAFQDLALASSKFAHATGLTVQDASRWKEVAGDIGIGSDSIQTAINKMNKELGTSPQLFNDLGIEIAKTDTGATDVNQTFLNVIDKIKGIKDPAERAKVATQLLGKGWMDMAELIQKGSSSLKKSLGDVSESKVIDPKEVEKAENLRETMDNLRQAVEDVSLALGEGLIPLLSDIGNLVKPLQSLNSAMLKIPGVSWVKEHFGFFPTIQLGKDIFNGLSDAMGGVWDFFSDDPPKPSFWDQITKGANGLWKQIEDLQPAIEETTTATNDFKNALIDADTAWKVLTNSLDQEVALDDAKIKLAELEAAAKKAFGSGAQKDIDDYDVKAAEFVAMLAAIAGGMSDISSKEILLRFKTQGGDAAVELAYWIANGAELNGLNQHDLLTMSGLNIPGFASGGSVSGGPILVGEKGPEIFVPGQAGTIIPNNAIGSSGNGNTINITVTSADPNAVVRALQSYNRNVGKIPVSVQ